MIYGITSKKSGCGRTTIAMMTAFNLLEKTKNEQSVLVMDLSDNNNLIFLTRQQRPLKSLDTLISSITFGSIEQTFDDCLVNVNGVNVIAGSISTVKDICLRRYSVILEILRYAEDKFNHIILDLNYDLYNVLVQCGLEIFPIHVMEQDILNIQEYHSEIQKCSFEGLYVVNNFRKEVFPGFKFFEGNFRKGSVVVIPEDYNLRSLVNERKLSPSRIKKTDCNEGINAIVDCLVTKSTRVNATYLEKYRTKKFSFFSRNKDKKLETKKQPKVKSNKPMKKSKTQKGEISNAEI